MPISPIQAKPAAPVKRAAMPAAAKPQAQSQMQGDEFSFDKPPSATKLAAARAAVAGLNGMPSIPFSNKDKAAWLADAQKREAVAKDGVKVLEDASFFTHSVPEAESDAARAKLDKLDQQIESCKERAGLAPTPTPLNPFRPLNETTKAVTSHMNNPIGAVAGAVVLPATMVVDAVDAVSRPLQAVAYPFEWAAIGLRKLANKAGVG